MVKTITFGVDAGHLMNRLLKHDGIAEVDDLEVLVQPEADDAVLELLREASTGFWVVRVDGHDGTEIHTKVVAVPSEGIFGEPVDDDARPLGPAVLRSWRSIKALHIY